MAKENNRETLEEKKEATSLYRQATSVNTDSLEDVLLRIGMGETVDLSAGKSNRGEGNLRPGSYVDTHADDADGDYEAPHIDFDSVFSKLAGSTKGLGKIAGKQVKTASKKPPVDFGDLTPVIKDIATFKYSSANRDGEINSIRQAIQSQMQTIVSQRVIDNTKEVSTNIRQFYRIKDGGMRVEFSLLNQKYSFAALGQFKGNEYLVWQVAGNDITGHVMRMDDDGEFENVTDEFKVTVRPGWKE